jgi:2,3-diketo-5-methylthio-1-phosphopentane phosphatase
MSRNRRILVSDFDGTMTQHDFYARVIDRFLTPEDLRPWEQYTRGELTHFDALQQIFAKIRASESELDEVLDEMQLDPQLPRSVQQLREGGWDLMVVSNGCRWYIDRLFNRWELQLTVHSNPGQFDPGQGLRMARPSDSPYYGWETGIDKQRVLEDCFNRYRVVAFAGDGRPDLQPALKVHPELRFARRWLADTLRQRQAGFHAFEVWSQIPERLLNSAGSPEAGRVSGLEPTQGPDASPAPPHLRKTDPSDAGS